jgi:hypothetical protein
MRLRLALALLLAAGLPVRSAGAEPAPRAGQLRLYVMPDTQSWAWNQGGSTLETWRSVAKEICRQRERFAMVLHTGDLVDQPRLRPVEWSHALSVMRELDACRMPYAIAFGNHDYDNYPVAQNVPLEGDRAWRQVMAQLAHRPAETGPSGRSALYPLAEGWFVVSADFVASRADLDWIAGAIAKLPGARFVFLNHHCVNAKGLVPGPSFEWCRTLVEQNPGIVVAVSGHWLGPRRDGWTRSVRANGRGLIALYQNYQHLPELAAWGVVIELDPASGAACVWNENLLSGELERPAASSPQLGKIAAGPARRCFEASGSPAGKPGID